MPYGYIDDGAPVEAVPGVTFTTPKLKIMTAEDEAHYGQTSGAVIDCQTAHPTNFAFEAPYLERYQIQQFDEAAAAPTGQRLATRTLALNAGVISVAATYEPIPVPDLVTRAQAWAELQATPSPVHEAKSLFDDICTAVFAANDPGLLAYFMGSQDYHRTHPKLLQAAGLLSLDSSHVDALFIAASQHAA